MLQIGHLKKAIKITMAEHDLNQSQLAEKAGLCQSFISNMTRPSNPSGMTVGGLLSITKGLGVELSELIKKAEALRDKELK